jgi:hypothetical protein
MVVKVPATQDAAGSPAQQPRFPPRPLPPPLPLLPFMTLSFHVMPAWRRAGSA